MLSQYFKEVTYMNCSNCGTGMEEVSKWQMAPFGGWVCPSCGLKISKKSGARYFKFMYTWK